MSVGVAQCIRSGDHDGVAICWQSMGELADRHGGSRELILPVFNTVDSGATALHWAVWNRNLSIAKLLITHRCEVNARDQDGHTPLMWAKQRSDDQDVQMVDALLDLGASATSRVLTLHHVARPGELEISATNLGGEIVGTIIVSESARVAEVRRRLAIEMMVDRDTDLDLVLPLPRRRVLDALDNTALAAEIFYEAQHNQHIERRFDRDGSAYIRAEFIQYYGTTKGCERWSQAQHAPDGSEAEAGCNSNAQVSEALLRTRTDGPSVIRDHEPVDIQHCVRNTFVDIIDEPSAMACLRKSKSWPGAWMEHGLEMNAETPQQNSELASSDSRTLRDSRSSQTQIIIAPPCTGDHRIIRLASTLELPSMGTSAHDAANPKACTICWQHHERRKCRFGLLCARCHADHSEIARKMRPKRTAS